ncbi:ribose-phosphate diphosphokinase [Niallia sp. Krafla_26]|uniref:ribose-phosphate diphosphokinase n=1 Tax=Niallia sp. Krafla_26 TaxID=3064703 RepID=UPI003D16BE92
MNSYLDPNLKVFSLSSNRELAGQIADAIGLELGKCSVARFSDGEIQIHIEESVRGCDVFVVQSTNAPVNEHLMELLIMVDALKRASAKSITAVVPYYAYARSDRKAKPREPITSKLVANLLQKAGATRMMTIDFHAPQLQGFFNIPIDHLVGMPILAQYLLDQQLDGEDIVVVTPNHNGVSRARKLAEYLHAPIAIIDKRRPHPDEVEITTMVGEVNGKVCILIDDMINTADTITLSAKTLVENGAKEVYAAVTHPILSENAIEKIERAPIKELIVTNTIKLPEEKRIDKLTYLSVGELIGEAIIRVHEEKPVSVLFE